MDEQLSISPFCAHLASKKSFFLGRPARDEEELLDGSQACWCARTMSALGPDRRAVDPDDCRAGRSCFVSFLDAGAGS
jgi:hypothetical protein